MKSCIALCIFALLTACGGEKANVAERLAVSSAQSQNVDGANLIPKTSKPPQEATKKAIENAPEPANPAAALPTDGNKEKTPGGELEAAESEKDEKEEEVAKVEPKKVTLQELLEPQNRNGIDQAAKPADSQFDNKLAVAMAGTGNEFEMGHGSGGLGFKGTGTGGGGDGGAGRIHGMGKIDTGGGKGVKRGLGKSKRKRTAKLKLSSGSTRGFCSKSDIASKVRRRAGAIRACYEKQLQRNPKLAGKVTARWTIGMDGRVKGPVSASGLGAVSGCIASKIRSIRFKPPEGGVCVIQWPFIFSNR